jgi:hypothetical protein
VFLNTLVRETTNHVLPGTVLGAALGSPPLQAALINLAVAAAVRLTSHLVTKRRARRARKAAADVNS